MNHQIFFKLFLSTEVGGKVHIEYQCCYQIVMLEYHYAHSESKKIKNFKKIVVVVFFFSTATVSTKYYKYTMSSLTRS